MSLFQAAETELIDMGLAQEIGEILEAHYPGWYWAVKIKSGVVFIQSLVVCEELKGLVKHASSIGMVVHYKNISDAGTRKFKIVMAAGELLERVNQKRGQITDRAREIRGFEGLH